jgi:hypothetical protein
MRNETMTPTEAMATIERLKLSISYSHDHKDWCATVFEPEIAVAMGVTPIEAVEMVLAKIARRKIEARLIEPLNKMSEQLKAAEAALTN